MIIGTARTPGDVARSVYEPIVHEWTHEQVRDHGDDFKQACGRNLARPGSTFTNRAMRALEDAYANPTDRGRLRPALARALSIYTDSRWR
jgi:hypothetical protein